MWSNSVFILEGILLTIYCSVLSIFGGMLFGTVLSICKVYGSRSVKLCSTVYISIFRGTPVILQLSIIHFAIPSLLGIRLGVMTSALIAFSLNSSAYVAEIIRAGIYSVDNGQDEAARMLAIPVFFRMKDIILPQAIRNIFPSLVNEFINLVKESALISTIGAMDLMQRAKIVSASTYEYFFPMMIAAFGYYILVLAISIVGRIIEKRLVL